MKINYTKNDEWLTLKAIKKEDAVKLENKFVINKDNSISVVSEDKTIYFVVEKKAISKYFLNKIIKKLIKDIDFNINIDLESFRLLFDCLRSVSRSFISNWIFEKTEQYSLKKDNKYNGELKLGLNLTNYPKEIEDVFERTVIKTNMVIWARDLQDTPPNVLHSEKLAEIISSKAKEFSDIKVTVLNKEQIKKENLNLLLAVNAASDHEARVVILEYKNSSSKATALVGKGICFDSGGYNLKNSVGMRSMKYDMTGAVGVAATVFGLAALKAKVNVVAVCMITDNLIGSKGTVPESVVKTINGVTVDISDTDAEGRLVLADGIAYAQAKYDVKKIIDLSTLTGSCSRAIGKFYSGVFLNNKELYNDFATIANDNYEQTWQLPLEQFHLDELIDNTNIADIASCAEDSIPDSSCAAAFLNYFVKDGVDYVHVDVAGTADEKMRGTGIMVKTFIDYIEEK